MKAISHERLLELVSYDPDSGIFTRRIARAGRAPMAAGSIQLTKYRALTLDRKSYLAHRLAWFYVTESWPKDQIDHINRDRDDNRFCNLREATCSQNGANSCAKKDHLPKGVSVYGRRVSAKNPFRAQIWIGGTNVNLGSYPSAEQAAEAYNRAAKEHWGDFAAP